MADSLKLTLPTDSTERLNYMRRMFPQAKGRNLTPAWRGGRMAALDRLELVDALSYGKNRQFINGNVTKLSPYLRHGCITSKEAVEDVKSRFGKQGAKLIAGFTYRDFSRQNWYRHSNAIYSDMEDPKVPLGEKDIPEFVSQGITGLPCMDEVIRDLMMQGYVHNHARLWFAAYMIHWLKVDWRKGADWFESQLLDGDIASNHLSWQWVASSFSAKPYLFDKKTLARFTGEKNCATCQVKCPFDMVPADMHQKLFRGAEPRKAKVYPIAAAPIAAPSKNKEMAVYVHDEMLSPTNPVMDLAVPKYYIFDEAQYKKWPLKRLQFIADCLVEMPGVEVWLGDTATVLNELGVGQIASQNTPNAKVKALVADFAPNWGDDTRIIDVDLTLKRLASFPKYWEKVGPEISKDNLNKPVAGS